MKNTMKKVLCTMLVIIICLTSAPLSGFVGLNLPNFADWFISKANAVDCQVFFEQGIADPNTQAILVFNLNGSTLKTGDFVYEPTMGQLVYKDGKDLPDPFIKLPRDRTTQNVGQYVNLPFAYSPEGYYFDGWYCYSDGVTYFEGVDYKIPVGAGGTVIEFIATYLSVEGMYTYRIENNEATIVDVDESISGNVIIPSTLGGYPVVAIDDYAFANKLSIESVNIPDGVTKIGNYAFAFCTHLKQLTLPKSLNNLGDAVFYSCRSLESITIPESVKEIKDYTFYKCVNLKEIKMSNTISSIGRWAFAYCRLSNIEFPETVVTIEKEAFKGCLVLEDIYINSKDVLFGEKAFGYTDIYLRENITMEQFLGWFDEDYCDTDEYNYTNGDVLLWSDEGLFDDVYPDILNEYLSKYVQAFNEDQKTNDTLMHCYRESTAKDYAVANDIDYVCFDHLYTEFAVTEPTCSTQGFTTYTCECGDSYKSDYTDMLEHEYLAEITTPATHLMEGVKTFTCECGDRYTEVIDKLTVHIYEKRVTVPTCTDKGYTTYTCACGDTYIDDYTDKIDHRFTNYNSDNNSTCDTDGTKTAYCEYGCTAYDRVTDVGSALSHDLIGGISNNDATHTYKCMREGCGYEENENCIFTGWQSTEDGESRTCTICGYKETKIATDDGDIEIVAPENPDEDFDADEVEPNDDKYILVEEAFEENHEGAYEILKAFDINLKNKDGVYVQPSGTVKVKLPLEWEKEGNYKVYRVNDDGTLTDMNAYRQGSHMVFETDHFSLYVIVDESEKPEEPADKNCSHLCHKSGFMGFIWKIINFFQKLFKTKQYCACGAKHW